MERPVRFRLAMVAVALVAVALSIGARLYQLQVVHRDRYRTRADEQHTKRVVVPAIRGSIVDRHGRPLAVSVESESLFVHPGRVRDPHRIARALAPVLGMRHATLLRRLQSDSPFEYLSRMLDPETANAVRKLGLPVGPNEALGFQTEWKRVYPAGRLGVHVVGFANIDGDGLEGVEHEFDYHLNGDSEVYLVVRDVHSGGFRQLVQAPEKEPSDVVLALDASLQHLVERELERAMAETGALASSAVLLDPGNGEILALANRPAADPNQFGKAAPGARINRALVHHYEPGSTFKIVPMAAALEQGVVHPGQRFFCENGRMRVGRRVIRDSSRHGTLTLSEILAKSSNIGMVKVVAGLDSSTLHAWIRRFGFGSKTGVQLPGETPGLVRSPPEWSALSRDSLAFGQEIGVSVLQMASALGTVANDGVRVSPRAVLGTRGADGRLVAGRAPARQRVVSEATARRIAAMMEEVLVSGTGSRARIDGYRAAGKSGTAQKAVAGSYSATEYMASFGGFAPVGSPRLVCLVVLDTPHGNRHHGGQVAAPVFARILDEALRQLRVPGGSAPTLEPIPVESRADTHDRVALEIGRVPAVGGLPLREAASRMARAGCRLEVRGSGSVVSQSPAAGEPVPNDGTCQVRLEATTTEARR